MSEQPSTEFCQFSARCGLDPLRVQGPGGNTSIKIGQTLWIKASGTELANATEQPIFVAVDRQQALLEAQGQHGDGSCHAARLDKNNPLRPSIETTFHAFLDWPVVAHTHSIATLVHAVSPQGRQAAKEKLDGLPFAIIGYHKPGLALTSAIIQGSDASTQVLVLQNHGLIVAGNSVSDVAALMDEVEQRLLMPRLVTAAESPQVSAPEGFSFVPEAGALATHPRLERLSTQGSYYPDHVVFLGSALNDSVLPNRPAVSISGVGVALRKQATSAQKAMLICLEDVLSRLPAGWEPQALSADQEAELLNWDAEKYRQALAEREV